MPRNNEETVTIDTTPKTLFQLLEEANNKNIEAKKPSILGTTQDLVSNTISIFAGAVEGAAKGMELANSYISEELDRQVASRTETKVNAVVDQFTAISRLTSIGASAEEAIKLATSYRL
jgi:hypothetical protein